MARSVAAGVVGAAWSAAGTCSTPAAAARSTRTHSAPSSCDVARNLTTRSLWRFSTTENSNGASSAVTAAPEAAPVDAAASMLYTERSCAAEATATIALCRRSTPDGTSRSSAGGCAYHLSCRPVATNQRRRHGSRCCAMLSTTIVLVVPAIVLAAAPGCRTASVLSHRYPRLTTTASSVDVVATGVVVVGGGGGPAPPAASSSSACCCCRCPFNGTPPVGVSATSPAVVSGVDAAVVVDDWAAAAAAAGMAAAASLRDDEAESRGPDSAAGCDPRSCLTKCRCTVTDVKAMSQSSRASSLSARKKAHLNACSSSPSSSCSRPSSSSTRVAPARSARRGRAWST
mmetsp:Transcript_11399/g.46204  ORF Transcript_11399/g.46204 Transcript_11399/m.46204 type:complete len:344 (-) Transcript_11399:118-1149(-)